MRRAQWPLFVVALTFSIRSSTAELCYLNNENSEQCGFTGFCAHDARAPGGPKCLSKVPCSNRWSLGKTGCINESPSSFSAPELPCVWDHGAPEQERCKDPVSGPANVCRCSNGTAVVGSACAVNNSNTCASCNAGYMLNYATKDCDACAAGTSSAGGGSTQCTPCAAGTFSASTASASCSNCPPGTFQDQEGKSLCKTHRVCDASKTVTDQNAHGVKDVSGTATTDTSCTTDCTKIKAAHVAKCGQATTCTMLQPADVADCKAIKTLYHSIASCKAQCGASRL